MVIKISCFQEAALKYIYIYMYIYNISMISHICLPHFTKYFQGSRFSILTFGLQELRRTLRKIFTNLPALLRTESDLVPGWNLGMGFISPIDLGILGSWRLYLQFIGILNQLITRGYDISSGKCLHRELENHNPLQINQISMGYLQGLCMLTRGQLSWISSLTQLGIAQPIGL